MTDIVERPWRCEITGNPCGTDTRMIGHSCQCQGCRAAAELERLRVSNAELVAALKPFAANVDSKSLIASFGRIGREELFAARAAIAKAEGKS